MKAAKTIPIHDFAKELQTSQFAIDLWAKSARYNISLPHRHNYYQILIFLKGGGSHEIDFNAYAIKPHSLHFVNANQVHVVKRKPGSHGFSMMFTGEFLPAGFSIHDFGFFKSGMKPVLNLTAKAFREINAVLEAVKSEYLLQQKKKRETLQALLQVFLIKAQRSYDAVSNSLPIQSAKNEITGKIEQLVEQKFRLHWRPHDYALELNISVSKLNTICNEHFSKSTESFIHERLLLEIKRMLVYSEKTVKEICYNLNFDDPAYFIRFFKKHTGITPLEYRKSVNH